MDPMKSGEEEELSSGLQVHGGGQLIEGLGRPPSVPLLFAPQGNVNITAKLEQGRELIWSLWQACSIWRRAH